MKKDDRIYLEHILECISDVRRYTRGGKKSFIKDDMAQNACLRQLQVMAESTMRLSPATKALAGKVDWGSIAGFRSILVHQYLGDIDLEKVWAVVRNDLVSLEKVARALLRKRKP